MNRGQKTLQEYKSINDLLPLHFIIQIFQKSFMSFANHKHQNYFLHWNYQIKISKHKFKVIHYLALLYKHLHVLNHHPLIICQHLIFNKYWVFFWFSNEKGKYISQIWFNNIIWKSISFGKRDSTPNCFQFIPAYVLEFLQ